MRRLLKFVLVTGIILAGRTVMATEIPDHDPHTLIVKFADHVDGKALARSLAKTKVAKIAALQSLVAAGVIDLRSLFPIPPRGHERQGLYDSLEMGQFFVLHIDHAASVETVRQSIRGFDYISSVAFNVSQTFTESSVEPDDFWYSLKQWNMPMIGMDQAWGITTGSAHVVVAVIDDGIYYTHNDLITKIPVNLYELDGFEGFDDDNNGYIDDIYGWDFGDSDNDPFPAIDGSHGTHVAGIIGAASNNAIGVAGMDWKCLLLPLKVQNSMGQVYVSHTISAIYYAAYMYCDILNLSLGSETYFDEYQTALEYAYNMGSFVVASSGNNNGSLLYPAGYAYVMAVGATDTLDNRWVWSGSAGSNFGDGLHVVAPGDHIYSSVPCLMGFPCPVGLYGYKTGTSMAAPHVAGLAALILSVRPNISLDSLFTYIALGAEDQVGDPSEDTPGWDEYYGWGRINAYNSLMLAMGQDPTGILESPEAAVPTEFSLYQNFPNPFNAQTIISFETQTSGPVKLEIFNILGQRVFVRDLNIQSPGPHSVPWNGLDQAGKSVPSGIYFYRVSADGLSQSRKMVLLK